MERERFDFFLSIPEIDRTLVEPATVKGSQMLEPLFEFSGACEGCGETPYLKLLTQLLGDRMIVANATGCSSIYGGNLPTTPWSANRDGRGPAWSNSLFEDNAEFGLGMRLALDAQERQARALAAELAPDLADALAAADPHTEAGIAEQRRLVAELRERIAGIDRPEARRLAALADALVRKSVWIVGGDGWAYDIGFGGLDHVLASGRDVNVLVLDTEVYSNTGGQASKATPRGAVAKFAAGGKQTGKKDLGLLATAYGNVYVAHIALGADNPQTVKALAEADAWDGPSLVIAYSHCIAHGIDMVKGMRQQKLAVDTGYWPLWRYDPRHAGPGEHPLHLDSGRAEAAADRVHGERGALLDAPPLAARGGGAARSPRAARRRRAPPRLRAAGRDRARARRAGDQGGGGGMSPDLRSTYLGLQLEEPARRIRIPAHRQPRLAARARGGRRCGRRAPVALRGADRARRDDRRPRARARRPELRRGAHLLPRDGRLQHGPGGVPRARRRRQGGALDPRDRIDQRRHPGGWIRYAELLQQAGADAIELNVYAVETDPYASAASVEDRTLRLVSKVHGALTVPLAVKVGPYYTAFANTASRLADAGADGLVLFNRFLQPDIDLETMTVKPELHLSRNEEMRLPLRWIAILRGRVPVSLAATSGVQSSDDVIKLLLAGADAVMLASALLRQGPDLLQRADRRALGLDGRARVQLGRAAEGQHEPGDVRRSSRVRALPVRPRARRLPVAGSCGQRSRRGAVRLPVT